MLSARIERKNHPLPRRSSGCGGGGGVVSAPMLINPNRPSLLFFCFSFSPKSYMACSTCMHHRTYLSCAPLPQASRSCRGVYYSLLFFPLITGHNLAQRNAQEGWFCPLCLWGGRIKKVRYAWLVGCNWRRSYRGGGQARAILLSPCVYSQCTGRQTAYYNTALLVKKKT